MSKKINSIINKENDKLDQAIDLLMKDIIDANIYNDLIKNIISEIKFNERAFNVSKTFWYLTIQALKDSRMIRLCRIFDKNESSVSIINLLEAIKENQQLFSNENFKHRLKDNPFVESLSKYNREIDLIKIDKEIELIKNNKTIIKIQSLRNVFVAHKSLKVGLNKDHSYKKITLEIVDLDDVLKLCITIINEYMNLFKAVSWSKTIIGHDDYKALFKYLNIGYDKYHEGL